MDADLSSMMKISRRLALSDCDEHLLPPPTGATLVTGKP